MLFKFDVILCGWLGSKHQLTNNLPPRFIYYGYFLVCTFYDSEDNMLSW